MSLTGIPEDELKETLRHTNAFLSQATSVASEVLGLVQDVRALMGRIQRAAERVAAGWDEQA